MESQAEMNSSTLITFRLYKPFFTKAVSDKWDMGNNNSD